MTKSKLRIYFKKKRQDFVLSSKPQTFVNSVNALAKHVEEAQIVAGTIGGYAAMASELDPQPMLDNWGNKGFTIALPWFESSTSDMQYRIAGGALEHGPWGIRQPARKNALIEPDTLLIPLVAADLNGNRLGQGQGHFDRILAGMRENRPIMAIGLAWECQIADHLPKDPWDQPLDYIATPDRLIKVTS